MRIIFCWFFVIVTALLTASPSFATTVQFDGVLPIEPPAPSQSPYDLVIQSQFVREPDFAYGTEPNMSAVPVFQVGAVLLIILVGLRLIPSASTAARRGRQALAAASARPRTRSIMARSPFDL